MSSELQSFPGTTGQPSRRLWLSFASSSPEEYPMEDAQLAAESQAWDMLSDEALEVFERQLEQTE